MQWASKLFGMGLLDPELEKRLSEAQRQQMGSASLMDAGLAMLANSGYSRMPTSTGQALAAGLGAGRASFAGQAQGLQEQMQRQQQAQAEEQQRQSILAGLDPEIQRFAAGLALPQLMDVAKQSAGEKAKAMNRAPQTSTLQREAAQLFPGDTAQQNAWIQKQREKSSAPVVNVSTAQTSPFDKALASKDADSFVAWRDAAMNAGGILDNIDVLQDINRLQQGGRVGEVAAILGEITGTDAAANRQTFLAAQRELVLQQTAKLSGAISEGELKLIEETLPRFGNDPRANEIIIGIIRRAAERTVENYKSADQYVNERGSLRGFQPMIRGGALPTPSNAADIDLDSMSLEELMRLRERSSGAR